MKTEMTTETIQPAQDQGCRKMPAYVREGLIQVNGGQLYLKAFHRILWMRNEHPDWAILTEIVYADYVAGFVVVTPTILNGEGNILATAHAEESRGKLPYLRKAETGAVSRALAMCGYGTQFGEIDAEDGDEESIADGPQRPRQGRSSRQPSVPSRQGAAPASINTGPGTCEGCRAPAGKPHGSGCKAAVSV